MKKLLCFGFIALFFLIAYIQIHEETHIQVAKGFNCSYVRHFNSVDTYCLNPNNEYLLAQSIVEGIGYHLLPVCALLLLIIFALSILTTRL